MISPDRNNDVKPLVLPTHKGSNSADIECRRGRKGKDSMKIEIRKEGEWSLIG